MSERPPPPSGPQWPYDHGGRRASDDYAAVLSDLRGDLRETRAEVVARLDGLGQQLDGQVQRLEERIRDERHSRRTTDATVSGLADKLDQLDAAVDDNRLSLARIAAPASGVALIVAVLVEAVTRAV